MCVFDGRILEFFGRTSLSGSLADSCRMLVSQLSVKTEQKKDDWVVKVHGPATEQFFRPQAADWDALQPLLDALERAGARVERS